MIFLIPIKNLVFDISGLPGIVCWTWGCGSDPLAFHPVRTDRQNLSRAVSGSYRIGTLPLACVMGCPLLSEVCSNYLTLENEILTSFLPLLSGRVWVESQEGNFPLNSAFVQITAPTADSQKNLLQRTWGWKQHHTGWVREPLLGPGFLHFCSVFV